MRQISICAAVAALVCVAAFVIEDRLEADEDEIASLAPESRELSLSYTVEPTEDSWVTGARSAGADERLLSNAESSICYLTKIEIAGFQGPEDRGTCRIAVDDFTGFWKVTAEVPEGSRSEIRCNARCLTWE